MMIHVDLFFINLNQSGGHAPPSKNPKEKKMLTEKQKDRNFQVMIYGILKEKELGLLSKDEYLLRYKEARNICYPQESET